METSFRSNGRLYNQYYAWYPTCMTSGTWVWLSVYYARETKQRGWVTMTPFEFLLDSTKD